MAPPRALWKGAISFGLVHVPVSLHPAARAERIDFDWLDKRSMQPVGYKRINKSTGKEIDKKHIVKGVKTGDDYVLISEEEIRAAYPKTTQTIEIQSFVPNDEIPFYFYDTPYFLAPIGRGEKVYALLRDTMVKQGVIGVAKLVINTRQHLAALIPAGGMLMVNTLRWATEIRSPDELAQPSKTAKPTAKELSMAAELVDDMRAEWNPQEFRDQFRDEILTLVKKKIKAGQQKTLNVDAEAPAPSRSAEVVDLTELLRQSLAGGRKGAARAAKNGAADEKPQAPSRKAAAKKKTARAKPAKRAA